MRKLSSLTLSGLALALAMATAPAAMAQQAGEYTVGVGAHVVSPKSNNGKGAGVLAGSIFDVHSDTKPTLTWEYFIAPNLGVEVLAALPFEMDAGTKGGGYSAIQTKVLPPTVTLQYHLDMGAVKPFAGVGLNYTTFWGTQHSTALPGGAKLSDSVGASVHLGTDIALNDQTSLRVDARWIDISSDLKIGGAKLGKVEVDPIVVGFAFVHKF